MDPSESNSVFYFIETGQLSRVKELIYKYGLATWQNGYSLLKCAAESGEVKIAEFLLAKGCQVNINAEDNSPLHTAVFEGNKEMVEILLQYGANINAVNKDFLHTPLHLFLNNINATAKDSFTPLNELYTCAEDSLEFFLDRGANVNSPSVDLYTPLHAAARNASQEIVQTLVRRGARLDAETEDSWTSLHFAAEGGRLQNVGYFVDRGLCIDAKTKKDMYTPLHIAVKHNREEIVDFLLQRGADVNAQCENDHETVLSLGVKQDRASLVRCILRHHPHINNEVNRKTTSYVFERFPRKYTFYDLSAHPYRESSAVVESLIEYGFKLNDTVIDRNSNYLFIAIENACPKTVTEILRCTHDVRTLLNCSTCGLNPLHISVILKQLEITKILASFGADVNAESSEGTPIVCAIKNADAAMFRFLLSKEADVKFALKLSPRILFAALKSSCEIVECLLERGAYVNVRDENGSTPLHIAVLDYINHEDSSLDMTKLLLRHGANVNALDRKGDTPLIIAATCGCVEVVKSLLFYRAKVNLPNIQGKTALFYALRREESEVSDILLRNGAKINRQNNLSLLQLYCSMGYLHSVKKLVEYGADVNARTPWFPPIHGACEEGRIEVVKFLLNCGADINLSSASGRSILAKVLRNSPFEKNVKIYDILLRHVMKMIALNLYVNESCMIHLNSGRTGEYIKAFVKQCEEEITRLKSSVVDNTSVSYYDVLAGSSSQLVNFSRNEWVLNCVTGSDLKARFPFYGSLIEGKLRMGIQKREWKDRCGEIMQRVFPTLNLVCIEHILDYLPINDLRMFIIGCRSGRVQKRTSLAWYLKTRGSCIRSVQRRSADSEIRRKRCKRLGA